MPHFECGAFNHSATSPRGWLAPVEREGFIAAEGGDGKGRFGGNRPIRRQNGALILTGAPGSRNGRDWKGAGLFCLRRACASCAPSPAGLPATPTDKRRPDHLLDHSCGGPEPDRTDKDKTCSQSSRPAVSSTASPPTTSSPSRSSMALKATRSNSPKSSWSALVPMHRSAPLRGRRFGQRRGCRPGPRQEGHLLQEASPPELQALARPSPAPDDRPHPGHRRRRQVRRIRSQVRPIELKESTHGT